MHSANSQVNVAHARGTALVAALVAFVAWLLGAWPHGAWFHGAWLHGAWLHGASSHDVSCPTCNCSTTCPLNAEWEAPKPHDDYMQYVSLRADGTGEMVMGDSQLVRTDVRIRYAAIPYDVIFFEYLEGAASRGRTMKFRIDTGDFIVDEPANDRIRERHFRCRLHFSENPFPPDVVSDEHLDYYSCER